MLTEPRRAGRETDDGEIRQGTVRCRPKLNWTMSTNLRTRRRHREEMR